MPYAGTFEKHIPYLQAGLSWLPTRFADHTVGPWAGKVTVDDMTYTNWLSIAGIEDDPLMWGKADIEAGLNALQWTVYRSTYAATCSNRVTVSGGYDWADAIVRQKEFWSDSEWCFNYDNSPIYGASARTFGSSFTPFAGAGRTKSHSMIGCATNVPCSIDIYYYMTGVNENEFHDFDGLGAEYGKLLLFETLPMEFPVLISSGRGIREGNMIGDYESNPMDLVTLSTTECDAKGIEASSMEAVLKWGFTPK